MSVYQDQERWFRKLENSKTAMVPSVLTVITLLILATYIAIYHQPKSVSGFCRKEFNEYVSAVENDSHPLLVAKTKYNFYYCVDPNHIDEHMKDD